MCRGHITGLSHDTAYKILGAARLVMAQHPQPASTTLPPEPYNMRTSSTIPFSRAYRMQQPRPPQALTSREGLKVVEVLCTYLDKMHTQHAHSSWTKKDDYPSDHGVLGRRVTPQTASHSQTRLLLDWATSARSSTPPNPCLTRRARVRLHPLRAWDSHPGATMTDTCT